MPFHVALLGDSIFDNSVYTRGEPDVVTHLRSMLPGDWHASLLAVDGSVSRHLADQLKGVSGDVTHLVISVGGNDVLRNFDLLALPVSSTTETLWLFGQRVSRFEADYRVAVDAALCAGMPHDNLHNLQWKPRGQSGGDGTHCADDVQRRHFAGRLRASLDRDRSAIDL